MASRQLQSTSGSTRMYQDQSLLSSCYVSTCRLLRDRRIEGTGSKSNLGQFDNRECELFSHTLRLIKITLNPPFLHRRPLTNFSALYHSITTKFKKLFSSFQEELGASTSSLFTLLLLTTFLYSFSRLKSNQHELSISFSTRVVTENYRERTIL